jgi:hypothetical protein
MVSPVVPFADPLSCMLLPRGMIGPWFHFGEALMQCLPPGKRTEVNLQWFKTLVDSWTPSQEQRNLCDLPAAVRPKPIGATNLKKAEGDDKWLAGKANPRPHEPKCAHLLSLGLKYVRFCHAPYCQHALIKQRKRLKEGARGHGGTGARGQGGGGTGGTSSGISAGPHSSLVT